VCVWPNNTTVLCVVSHASTHCIDVSRDSDVRVRLRCFLDVVSRAGTGRGRVGVSSREVHRPLVRLRSRVSSCVKRAAACNSELTDDKRRPGIVDVLLMLLPSSSTNSLQPTTNR